MKTRLLCVILCLAMVLSFAGCGNNSTYPEGYEKHKAIIGETKADAIKKLKLQESDLKEVISDTYQIPGTFSFCGYDFEMVLLLDKASGRIFGFTYWVVVDDLSGFVALREKLMELYGKPDQVSFSEEEFEKVVHKRKGAVGDLWSLYPFTEEHHAEYARILEEYKERLPESPVRAGDYTWNLALTGTTHLDEKYIIIMDFSVGADYTQPWRPGQDR